MTGFDAQDYDALLAFTLAALHPALKRVGTQRGSLEPGTAPLSPVMSAEYAIGPPEAEFAGQPGSQEVVLRMSLSLRVISLGTEICSFSEGQIVLGSLPHASTQPPFVVGLRLSTDRAGEGSLGKESGGACPLSDAERRALVSLLATRFAQSAPIVPLFRDILPADESICGSVRRVDFARAVEGEPSLLLGVVASEWGQAPAAGPRRSFLRDGHPAGLVVGNEFYLRCVHKPKLEAKLAESPGSGEPPEFHFTPDPPTIAAENVYQKPGTNFRVTRYSVSVDAGAGALVTKIEFSDSGKMYQVPWSATGSLTTALSFSCQDGELWVTFVLADPDIEIDIDWLAVLIMAILVGIIGGALLSLVIAAIGPAIAVTVATVGKGAAIGGGVGLLVAGAVGAFLEDWLEGKAEDEVRARFREFIGPLQDFGGLKLPMPLGTDGLLQRFCELDDWAYLGDLVLRDDAPVASEGVVELGLGDRFDLDTGRVLAAAEPPPTERLSGLHVDVLGDNPVFGTPDEPGVAAVVADIEVIPSWRPEVVFAGASLGALNGAGFDLPAEHYDQLTLDDLSPLPYLRTRVEAAGGDRPVVAMARVASSGVPVVEEAMALPEGAPDLTGGRTFAARTSAGRFAKCQVVARGPGRVQVRYRTYDLARPHVGLEESLVVTETRPTGLRVKKAHRAEYTAFALNVPFPCEYTWTLDGQPVAPGTGTVAIGGADVEVTVAGSRLSLQTGLGQSVSALVAVEVRDADQRRLQVQRTVTVHGVQRAVPEPHVEPQFDLLVNGVRHPTGGSRRVTATTRRRPAVEIRRPERRAPELPATEREMLLELLRKGGHRVS